MTKYLILPFISALILCYTPCRSQTQLDTCIARLQSAECGDVFQARNIILLKYQKESIPKLISLLKDTGYVKLVNTADLIYPGAKEFYGHGTIINYDIDWISVRAAWVLEQITFQNFGYLTQIPISKEALFALHQKDYQNYLNKGYHDINYQDTTTRGRLIISRMLLAKKAFAWWKHNKADWTKLKALKEALASHDTQRENLAIYYLRQGDSFDAKNELAVRQSYFAQIKPLVVQIKNSKDSESDQAEYLLKEMENPDKK
ncbi:MAG TPA: hypothetical protein VNX40_01125 [Mucilaginibacter sp.]|nr:hypothetical protein [Mucilaginibacter sp.]